MKRSTLFDRGDHNDNTYYYTPRKAKVHGAVKFTCSRGWVSPETAEHRKI